MNQRPRFNSQQAWTFCTKHTDFVFRFLDSICTSTRVLGSSRWCSHDDTLSSPTGTKGNFRRRLIGQGQEGEVICQRSCLSKDDLRQWLSCSTFEPHRKSGAACPTVQPSNPLVETLRVKTMKLCHSIFPVQCDVNFQKFPIINFPIQSGRAPKKPKLWQWHLQSWL